MQVLARHDEEVGVGKVKYLGLSEASIVDIRYAHTVRFEYSLWTRDMEEDAIPACTSIIETRFISKVLGKHA